MRERFARHRGLAIPTYITPRAVMHAGIANLRFPLKSVAGKTSPAFPAHVQPAILRILQEAHGHNCPYRMFVSGQAHISIAWLSRTAQFLVI